MRTRSQICAWFLIAMLVPVVYVASFMPLSWAYNRKYLGTPGSPSARVFEIYVVPLAYSVELGPTWYRHAFVAYAAFLNRL